MRKEFLVARPTMSARLNSGRCRLKRTANVWMRSAGVTKLMLKPSVFRTDLSRAGYMVSPHQYCLMSTFQRLSNFVIAGMAAACVAVRNSSQPTP